VEFAGLLEKILEKSASLTSKLQAQMRDSLDQLGIGCGSRHGLTRANLDPASRRKLFLFQRGPSKKAGEHPRVRIGGYGSTKPSTGQGRA